MVTSHSLLMHSLQRSPLRLILWASLTRWKKRAEKKFVSYGILPILLPEKEAFWAELGFPRTVPEKKKKKKVEN